MDGKIQIFFILLGLSIVFSQQMNKTYVQLTSKLNNINGQTTPRSEKNKIKQNNQHTLNDARELLPRDCGKVYNFSDSVNSKITRKVTSLPDQQRQDNAEIFKLRIFGGENTVIDEFPWKVILQFRRRYNNQSKVTCGGSIINKRYILTVAHCIVDFQENHILDGVRLGEYNKSSDPDCERDAEGNPVCTERMVFAEIEQEIIHENYSKYLSDKHNDIALLRLSRDINFTNFIQPICLPDRPAPNDKFYVVGWGSTENRSESDIPLKVLLPLVPRDQCQVAYAPNKVRLSNIIESQICAGGEEGKDSCRGDSGSPLMQIVRRSDESSRWTQYGSVSYGMSKCGKVDVPGVYTDVNYFMPWILSKIKP